jgi:hypothetical protein
METCQEFLSVCDRFPVEREVSTVCRPDWSSRWEPIRETWRPCWTPWMWAWSKWRNLHVDVCPDCMGTGSPGWGYQCSFCGGCGSAIPEDALVTEPRRSPLCGDGALVDV